MVLSQLDCYLPESCRAQVVEQFQTAPAGLPTLCATLMAHDAWAVVECLKTQADRYWGINASYSIELADQIIAIGEACKDTRMVALGLMARGDALKIILRMPEAWETLDKAGELFRSTGDEVGWARTRIGKLFTAINLGRVHEALDDAHRAEDIFIRYNRPDRLLRLYNAVAQVYDLLGDFRESLLRYQAARTIAESLGDSAAFDRANIDHDTGYAYLGLGNLDAALQYFKAAEVAFNRQGREAYAVISQWNIASIYLARGDYREALRLFSLTVIKLQPTHPIQATQARNDIVECYLALNRYEEALELAQEVINECQANGEQYQAARTFLFLATAQAYLENYPAAQAALDEAETIFRALDHHTRDLIAIVQVRRGQIALRQGQIETAHQEAAEAAAVFQAGGQQGNLAAAMLLEAQALKESNDPISAKARAQAALKIARQHGLLAQRYSGYLLLGSVKEKLGQTARAQRYYRAAAGAIERAQHGLTITLRPGFLEDKQEAFRSLMRLNLQSGQTANAFLTLERSKSQVLLSYLAGHKSLHWLDTPQTRPLINELNTLRDRHQWLYRQAYLPPAAEEKPPVNRDAENELPQIERRMRAITDQLYLYTQDDRHRSPTVPTLADLQAHLDAETLLIAFYTDGKNLWAFSLDDQQLAVQQLPLAAEELKRLVSKKLVDNLEWALEFETDSTEVRGLTSSIRRMGEQLYQGLIAPLESRLGGRKRLVIVPFGVLHYLPFNLLRTPNGYLIEQYEIVILPSAALLTNPTPCRPRAARVLANTWDARLPLTTSEGQQVQNLFGGEFYSERAARYDVLQAPPCQILHIATHGEHRIHQPDFSYIQLADRQLFTDDLLQLDLSYELVTLSACETGRAQVAPGDELIGLGRGFLYAGAGALVASLWRVDETITVELMERMYRALRAGASKAAALQQAQRELLQREPELHPAFWSAFQLIGNPAPLSVQI